MPEGRDVTLNLSFRLITSCNDRMLGAVVVRKVHEREIRITQSMYSVTNTRISALEAKEQRSHREQRCFYEFSSNETWSVEHKSAERREHDVGGMRRTWQTKQYANRTLRESPRLAFLTRPNNSTASPALVTVAGRTYTAGTLH